MGERNGQAQASRAGVRSRAAGRMAALLLLAALAACSSGGSNVSAGSSSSTSAGPTSSATLGGTLVGGGPVVLRLTEQDRGRTITVPRLRRVTVILASTYWSISTPPDPRILRPIGAVRVAGDLRCRPIGRGCGTVTALYRAVGPGTTTIGARRTTCGEAMRCAPPQVAWKVTVTVTA